MSLGVPASSPSQAVIAADYDYWVRTYDTLSEADAAAIVADVARIAAPKLLSLLLPVGFAAPEAALATLASLREQFYPHWQVLIAGAVPDAVAALAADDARIVLVERRAHAHRATAAAAALARADGRHVAFLAEGDILSPHALYEIALELTNFADAELVYTDEDRIDGTGRRSAPRFKTGWDADLLLSHDYIGGLAFYSRAVIEAVGGPRIGAGAGYGPVYGYDLALRATARMLPDRIRHIPAVLLHRPSSLPETLRDLALGPAAHAARLAVADFLGDAATVSPAPLLPSCHRITWKLPTPRPFVSVIMPTRDRVELLVPAAWGVLLRTDYPDLELIIVDNDSREAVTQTALRDLQTQARVRVLSHPGPFNFSAINNAAVRAARGEVIVLLNNDIDVIHPEWLTEMVSLAMRPDVGAVGAKLLYADGQVQHGGVVLLPGPNATHMRLVDRFDVCYGGQLAVTRSFSAVTGACLAMRRSVFEEVGGLDETNFVVAFNDVDLCLRLGERGYRVLWTPFAELFHLESASRGSNDSPEKIARERQEVDLLDRLWRVAFAHDPFSNPNLFTSWHVPLRLCAPRRPRPWLRGDA